MNKSMKMLGITATMISCCLSAQAVAEVGGEFDLSFAMKTNHLWHGFIVTDGVMTAGALEYKTADKKTTFGLWAGGSFNGEYKEFTYYASHKFSDNFFVEIVNHGNHSGIADDEVDIFNYSSDDSKTGNFTDIGMGYTFSGDTPISLYYAIIIQGVDKHIDDSSGELERSYTNYIEVSAPVWHGKNGETVNAFVGGAFSPVHKRNFYSDNANINNVGFTFSKEINLLNTSFPVSATAMWNPALNHGALQVAVELF